jgi:hypothetical protein
MGTEGVTVNDTAAANKRSYTKSKCLAYCAKMTITDGIESQDFFSCIAELNE